MLAQNEKIKKFNLKISVMLTFSSFLGIEVLGFRESAGAAENAN